MVESFASSVDDPVVSDSVDVKPESIRSGTKRLQHFVKVEVGNLLEYGPLQAGKMLRNMRIRGEVHQLGAPSEYWLHGAPQLNQNRCRRSTLGSMAVIFAARLWGGSVHPSIVAMPLAGHAVVLCHHLVTV